MNLIGNIPYAIRFPQYVAGIFICTQIVQEFVKYS